MGGVTTRNMFPDIINCVTLHLVGYILEHSLKFTEKMKGRGTLKLVESLLKEKHTAKL